MQIECTSERADLVVVMDNLNTHASETLVRCVAECIDYTGELATPAVVAIDSPVIVFRLSDGSRSIAIRIRLRRESVNEAQDSRSGVLVEGRLEFKQFAELRIEIWKRVHRRRHRRGRRCRFSGEVAPPGVEAAPLATLNDLSVRRPPIATASRATRAGDGSQPLAVTRFGSSDDPARQLAAGLRNATSQPSLGDRGPKTRHPTPPTLRFASG